MDTMTMIVDRLDHLHLDFSASEIGAWVLKEKADDEVLSHILSFVDTMAAKADMKAQEMMMRLSRLPQKDPKLFSSFDTSRLPDDSRKAVSNLETLSFIHACRNIIMVGPAGTGKTHLAEAIGNECCRRRMRTYFIKMQELKDRFRSSIISGSTGRLLSGFLKYQCIIIDEVGYCTFDKDETRLFFQMVDRLSTRGSGSVILTSNRDVSDWSEFFSDMDALECALDRLCDNAICISFSGESYRGRDRTSVSLDFTNPIIRMGN